MSFRFLDQLDYLLSVVKLGVVAEGLADNQLFLVLHVYRVSLLHNLLLLAIVVVVALEVVDELDFVRGEDFVGLSLLCLLAALVRFGHFLDDVLPLVMLPSRALSLLLALVAGFGGGDLLLNDVLLVLLLLFSNLLMYDALDLACRLRMLSRRRSGHLLRDHHVMVMVMMHIGVTCGSVCTPMRGRGLLLGFSSILLCHNCIHFHLSGCST